jgi:hypothetical protein
MKEKKNLRVTAPAFYPTGAANQLVISYFFFTG